MFTMVAAIMQRNHATFAADGMTNCQQHHLNAPNVVCQFAIQSELV
jgi:hypothetical protein